MSLHVPNQYRVRTGPMGSDESYGNLGAFQIPVSAKSKRHYTVIVSDECGWEHVSVSLPDRTPSWDEMCTIKALFWGPDDCVVQYHPPRWAYINNHPHCLHLWRSTDAEILMPPAWMVGVKKLALQGGE